MIVWGGGGKEGPGRRSVVVTSELTALKTLWTFLGFPAESSGGGASATRARTVFASPHNTFSPSTLISPDDTANYEDSQKLH